ncbi:MBOAT family protein [Sulfidibacter corallicola]|uniref:MBOAT family protein n=1 Tax=Sulfidibacter corallicola TaxID=2818388 RepID=A0A8A4TER1_SULCO|nr:MBOAT family O-acyltransferase [Sulfidibacter corallicola]QTD48030.1 MBOAT family protein [Sulfidibacter corallicola]
MLFNSFEFIFVFLPIVLLSFFTVSLSRRYLLSRVVLVLGSLFFYGYWDYRYLPLILFSIVVNYALGILLSRKQSRMLLTLGLTVNLALLGYFKYVGFFIENINAVLGYTLADPHIVLPLAISFFTFQQIAYLVDSYRQLTREYDFVSYSLFVCFFPQLIAGPIVHHKEILPQFKEAACYLFLHENFAKGIFIFFFALFKKVVIADTLALWATPGFDQATELSFIEAWGTILSYTFQIYFDFSAYSEMALGLGLMCNIKIPVNFRSPYKANNIVDFWRRWHITLSRFLRDYLYIPLGGNRKGKGRRYVNLMLTMLLGGLWHGAGWTFVIWGGLHGLYLILNHGVRATKIQVHWMIGRLATFLAVLLSWVFFRATDFEAAIKVCRGLVGLSGFKLGSLHYFPGRYTELVALPLLFLIVNFAPNTLEVAEKMQPDRKWALLTAVIIVCCIANMNKVSEFIYFQF